MSKIAGWRICLGCRIDSHTPGQSYLHPIGLNFTRRGWIQPSCGHFSFGLSAEDRNPNKEPYGPMFSCPYAADHKICGKFSYRVIDEDFYLSVVDMIKAEKVLFFKKQFYPFDVKHYSLIVSNIQYKRHDTSLVIMQRKQKMMIDQDKVTPGFWKAGAITLSLEQFDAYMMEVVEFLSKEEQTKSGEQAEC